MAKCHQYGCLATPTTVLHLRGELASLFCLEHADELMYVLSLSVPEDEGRKGYASWRAEVGLEPVRWPK